MVPRWTVMLLGPEFSIFLLGKIDYRPLSKVNLGNKTSVSHHLFTKESYKNTGIRNETLRKVMEIRVSLKKRMLMGEFFSLQGSGGPPTAVLHFSRR